MTFGKVWGIIEKSTIEVGTLFEMSNMRLKMQSYKELETAELRQWYMNAYATRHCLGHKKHNRNRRLTELYREELQSRGENVPSDEEVKEFGKFNGQGSS